MNYEPEVCIYHGDCDDGFASAYIVKRKWPNCTLIPATYGKPFDLETVEGKHVLMVDFSFKRDGMVALGQVAKSVIVLDHHKTAMEELKPWTIGDDSSLLVYPTDGITQAVFDMEHSGCALTWKFCHPVDALPGGFAYIEDRDLWRFKFENTKAFSAGLRTYPQDLEVWEGLLRSTQRTVAEGKVALMVHTFNVSKFIKDAHMINVCGHMVPACNVPYHYASDTADALLKAFTDAPFTAAYFARGDGQVQYSLRSTYERADVSEIAERFGGGGHRNAAGFQTELLPLPMPIKR